MPSRKCGSRIRATAAIILALSSGCSKNFSREEASQLLEVHLRTAYPPGQTLSVPFKSLEAAGLMALSIRGFGLETSTTAEGKKYFSEIESDSSQVIRLALVEPLRRQLVEVTGISTGVDRREVEYTWRYDTPALLRSLPGVPSELTHTQRGRVTFILYDSGWKIQ